MQYTEKFIEIDAPLERVFDLFSNFENFPRWMRNIKDVHYSGRHFTRWTAAAPLGSAVEWEAETTVYQPDHKIAWRSVRGDVDTEGEVIFEETRRGTTRLHVILGYEPPAGRLGAMIASLFGTNPEQQLEDDLERFAAVAEGRRSHAAPYRDAGPRRDEYAASRPSRSARGGNEHGRRGFVSAERDERAPRSSRREAEGSARREVEEEVRRRARPDDRYDSAPLRDRRTETPQRGVHGSRFDEELRAARRSQIEGQRRYMEDRGREERRRYMERDEELGREALHERADERRERALSERERYADDRDEPSHRDEQPHRYAMTPRERERERRHGREPDYGYSRKLSVAA